MIWKGYLLNGSDPNYDQLNIVGTIVIDGVKHNVGPGEFSIAVIPGAHRVIADAIGYDPNDTVIIVDKVAFYANISLPPPVCQSDCSLDGRCEYAKCAAVCTLPTDQKIITACNENKVGTYAKLIDGSSVYCCSGAVVDQSLLRTSFNMSTCSDQVFPMQRQVVSDLDGTLYTLVATSYKDCTQN